MPLFETSITLNCSPEKAFDFLIVPRNHMRISPPEMGLNFIDPPDQLTLGSQFSFKVQSYGMVQQIVHEVTELERPFRYAERQVTGPLKAWSHLHLFEATPEGGVVIIDRIEFEPPGGLVGLLVNEAKLRDSLEDGFYHRHQELKKLLEVSA